MDEQIARSLKASKTFDDLIALENNAQRLSKFDAEVEQAIKERAGVIGRELVAQRTGLDFSNLTPAEERIVQVVGEYAYIQTRKGTNFVRTTSQLKNRGLLGAAETAVAKNKPTQGYQTLKEENLSELSYEQIVLDYPQEFTPRAVWFSRRTLGLPNSSEKAPAAGESPTQVRTEELLEWFEERANSGSGHMGIFTNADAAAAIGMDLSRYGRVFGNIQSRIDYACYEAGLPPLGLTAESPFNQAWSQGNRPWTFPVESMQRAAKSYRWQTHDFNRLRVAVRKLSGQASIAWVKELAEQPDAVRAWAYGLEAGPLESSAEAPSNPNTTKSNPDWSREEHILALDLYLRFRTNAPSKDAPEISELSEQLIKLAKLRGVTGGPTFRNANGVHMKLMNFRRFDPEYTQNGRTGLPAGSKNEEEVWNEFAHKPDALAEAVADILAVIEIGQEIEDTHEDIENAGGTYWVFVCNPDKWDIERFLSEGISRDTWGIRPSDREKFAPGQLAIVRVGVDSRSAKKREGRPKLQSGIYAICEVESAVFAGAGANGQFWAEGSGREAGWPTVKIRYLKSYLSNPLTIERLRAEKPHLSHLLLNGFQAASFPISGDDFQAVVELLKEDIDGLPIAPAENSETPDDLTRLEDKYLNASPEVKERVSRYIERGPVGDAVKKANGYRCQLCESLGLNPLGFEKKRGGYYVEAHHVTPVSKKEIGTLASANIVTLCANHHRQIHYGNVTVEIEPDHFKITIDGRAVPIRKFSFSVNG